MSARGMQVLVTGATGFLGGCAAERLRERGAVVAVQGRDAGKLDALRERGFAVHAVDLGEQGAASQLIEAADPDLVLHAAALSAPFGPRRAFERSNTFATEALALAAARHARVRGFLHVSTPSVYCAGAPLRLVREDAPLPRRAINHYAASKRRAEERLRAIDASEGLPQVILRPRAIFGPGDTALFPRLVRALERRRLPILGDGAARVDLTYVDNVCLACERALDQLAAGAGPALGNTYNITNGDPIALWPLIRHLAEQLDLAPPSRRIPRLAARTLAGWLERAHGLLRRPGEPVLTRYSVDALSLDATLDISRARADLDYAPEVSISAGLERFLRSIRAAAPER